MTLLEFLLVRYPNAKRQTLRRMLDAGRVQINGQRARSVKTLVCESDVVRVSDRVAPATMSSTQKLPFDIVNEDDDVLLIDKPAGLLTSTVPREKRATALAAVRDYLASDRGVRVGLIHRLDRDASGLLIFSKNDRAYESLKQQFFDHSVDRIYHAIIQGTLLKPPEGRIESYLIERADGSVHSTGRTTRGAQQAITDYIIVRSVGGRSLVRIKLHTGRKHQIRAQLSERGRAIVNDPIYSDAPRTGRLMLAATELAFAHPRTSQRMHFQIPLPRELSAALTGRQ
jgi:23S rRNA pseudouridine1911/1915/1917 synthase